MYSYMFNRSQARLKYLRHRPHALVCPALGAVGSIVAPFGEGAGIERLRYVAYGLHIGHNAKSVRWSHRTDIFNKGCIAQRGIVPPLIDQHPVHCLPVHLVRHQVTPVWGFTLH